LLRVFYPAKRHEAQDKDYVVQTIKTRGQRVKDFEEPL
jgi:hypothetical protein